MNMNEAQGMVARARAILVAATRAANEPSYQRLADDIAEARPAKIDSWIALNAIVAALAEPKP